MEENENLDAFPARGPLRKTKKRHKLLRKNSEQRQKLFKIAMDKNQTKPEVFSKLEEELRSLSGEEKLKLVQEVDDRGNTALHYASKAGHHHHHHHHYHHHYQNHHYATKAGHLQLCKLLYASGADLNKRGQNKMKPLQFAARYGDEKRPEDIWKCIEWIMKEYERNEKGQQKMGGWVQRKNESESFNDVRERDKYDFTILHHAIQNTNWEEKPVVVMKLIESKKFRITDTDRQGNTSLHLAAQFDKQENHQVFDVFLDNPNISDEDLAQCIEWRNRLGMTPLHVACGIGNHDSVEQLIKEGREKRLDVQGIINSADNNGSLPLNLAIESNNLEMMEILIKEGARVSEDTIYAAAR